MAPISNLAKLLGIVTKVAVWGTLVVARLLFLGSVGKWKLKFLTMDGQVLHRYPL